MILENFIIELLNKGIPVNEVVLTDNNTLGYVIPGFSKSGTVTLFVNNEHEPFITCSGRYGVTDDIHEFDDLVRVAFHWYLNYKDRSPFETPDSIWLPHFIQSGRLKVEEEVIKKYVVR